MTLEATQELQSVAGSLEVPWKDAGVQSPLKSQSPDLNALEDGAATMGSSAQKKHGKQAHHISLGPLYIWATG